MVAPHYPLMRNFRALYKVLGGPGKPFMGGQLRQHLAEGVGIFQDQRLPRKSNVEDWCATGGSESAQDSNGSLIAA